MPSRGSNRRLAVRRTLLLTASRPRVSAQGEVHYAPKVLEKEQADAAYRQAANSETHSATLGAVEDASFSVKLDKVWPPGPPAPRLAVRVEIWESGNPEI